MVRARWMVIVVFGLWSVGIWSVRILNLWDDLLPSTTEKLWRTGLAATFIVLGLAVVAVGWGLRRWPPTGADRAAVGILAGWTVGVWASRTVGLLGAGHAAAFVVVHLVLAAASVALAVLAWRAVVAAAIDTEHAAVEGGDRSVGIGPGPPAERAEAGFGGSPR